MFDIYSMHYGILFLFLSMKKDILFLTINKKRVFPI